METVYEHIRGDSTFTVTAAERWSTGMIRRLAKEHPDDVCIVHENPDGSIVAHVPLDWMRIVPKHKRAYTDEQRAAMRDRLAMAREKKLG